MRFEQGFAEILQFYESTQIYEFKLLTFFSVSCLFIIIMQNVNNIDIIRSNTFFEYINFIHLCSKMTKSNELRDIVIAHHLDKVTIQGIYDRMAGRVGRSTIHRWIDQFNENGRKTAMKPPGRPRKASNDTKKKEVKRLINRHSQRQVAKQLAISKSTVGRIIKTLKLQVVD